MFSLTLNSAEADAAQRYIAMINLVLIKSSFDISGDECLNVVDITEMAEGWETLTTEKMKLDEHDCEITRAQSVCARFHWGNELRQRLMGIWKFISFKQVDLLHVPNG